jgi:pyrroloquinoline quinone (PQQ) biosynthesis protein C
MLAHAAGRVVKSAGFAHHSVPEATTMATTSIASPSLSQLMEELASHPVNRHPFFLRFQAEYLNRRQLQTFFSQYHYFCKHFVKVLEGLLYATPVDEVEMRVELIKTLYSELGSGSCDRAHVKQLEGFGHRLGVSEFDLQKTQPIHEVRTYLGALHRLFTECDYLTALGAELAVETTAISEFRYFTPGLAKYTEFTPKELVFFESHLQEEEHHSKWLVDAVRKTATTPEGLMRVAIGAREAAGAWHAFWDGLYHEVFQERSSA